MTQGGGGGCDTLANFDVATSTPTIYTAQSGGYVAGQNGYGDISKADIFTNNTANAFVDQAIIVLV